MQKVAVFVLTMCFLQFSTVISRVMAEPYTGEDFPSDELMFRSFKKRLEKTGRLYFGEVRILGKSLSDNGILQIFFCTGLKDTGLKDGLVDITRERRAIPPKWSEDQRISLQKITDPLNVYSECSVFDILRLDSGTWVMKKGTQFVVIEE